MELYQSCTNLKSVILPASVTTIEDGAFMYCDSLSDVYYSGSKEQWNAITIGSDNECLTTAKIHYNSSVEDIPTDYSSLWIEQHMQYASSEEYESEIIPGFTGKLDNVFDDAMDDTAIKAYNLLDAVTSFLNAKGDMDESELYQLILADILYSRTDEDMMQEIYAQNLHTNTIELLEFLVNSEQVISFFKDSETYKTLLDNLSILQNVDIGSGDFSKAYTAFMNTLKGNVSLSNLKPALSKSSKLTALSIGLDKLFTEMEAIEDIMQYIINCMAYQSTSEDFKEVMRALADKANTMTGDAYFPKLRDYDCETDWKAMRDSINAFVDALDEYEQEGMKAVAEAAVKANKEADSAFASSAIRKIAVLGFDTIIGCIPVLNYYGVVKAALCGGQLLIELCTGVDERAYSLEMMARIYCFSVLMDSVVDDYAKKLTKDDLKASTLFDEAVSVYRSVIYHGAEYGITYVNAKLVDVFRRYMGPFISGGGSRHDLEKIRWYQSDLDQLKYQQEKIQAITCHDPALHYDPESGNVYYDISDAKLFIVACPVQMTITSANGEQIAVLADSSSEIPAGYENYFRVIETEPGSGEYMKVAIVPEGYAVTLQGTGRGTMNAAVIEYHDGVLEDPEFFLDIPVTAQSEGYFDEKSEEAESDELVFDNTVHDGESGGCPFTNVPSDSFYYTPVLWALENGITNGATATTFNPSGECLRAQVATFLWRATGCPEPTSTSTTFLDVKPSDFFYAPVLWAEENGIVNGMSETHFGPLAECNRAQIVTILYRMAGSPTVEGEMTFTDIPAGTWYTEPVLWAVENGITNGISATEFGPNAICNRAQVVTFLYRAYTS